MQPASRVCILIQSRWRFSCHIRKSGVGSSSCLYPCWLQYLSFDPIRSFQLARSKRGNIAEDRSVYRRIRSDRSDLLLRRQSGQYRWHGEQSFQSGPGHCQQCGGFGYDRPESFNHSHTAAVIRNLLLERNHAKSNPPGPLSVRKARQGSDDAVKTLSLPYHAISCFGALASRPRLKFIPQPFEFK